MITGTQVKELIRSVSFGALSVTCLLLLAYSYFPHWFPVNFGYREVISVGTLVGTVVHRGIHALIFNPLTKSITDSFAFYAKLAEAYALYRKGVIDEGEYRRISEQLKAGYFRITYGEARDAERPVRRREEVEASQPWEAEQPMVKVSRERMIEGARERMIEPDFGRVEERPENSLPKVEVSQGKARRRRAKKQTAQTDNIDTTESPDGTVNP